jgi:uncharacterized protein
MLPWLLIVTSTILLSAEGMDAQIPSKGTYYALRLKPHDDLRAGVTRFAKEHKLKAASIVSCVGSLEVVNLRYANQNQGAVRSGFFEIVSMVGTVNESSSHLHVFVSDSSGMTTGGHLLEGCKIYTTAEIVLVELNDVEFQRETDSAYNYQELVVKKRKKE